jgi:hypothetical protein
MITVADLYPQQQEAVALLKRDISAQGWAFLRAGQRSGKSVIAQAISCDYHIVCLYSGTYNDAWAIAGGWESMPNHIQSFPPSSSLLTGNSVLVVIDAAMWAPNSFSILEQARKKEFDVLVTSSNGPEFMKEGSPWKHMPGRSYASWELNPALTEAELRATCDYLFDRDFAGY